MPAAHAHSPTPLPADVRVAVIGSGFSGLGSAVRLRQRGITDFVVLERAGSVGGTWRDSTYPGLSTGGASSTCSPSPARAGCTPGSSRRPASTSRRRSATRSCGPG